MRNSKLQSSSSKQAPNFKLQTSRCGQALFCSLVFDVSLELGPWSLELFPRSC